MNLINQHIRKHLLHFKNEEDAFFKEVVALIQSEVKEKHIFLLRYIHLLLDESFSGDKQETKTLHLHFEYDLNDDTLLVIAQYLLIRFFIENSKTKSTPSNKGNIRNIKRKLISKSKRLKQCPEGAKGGNRIYKKWIKDKKNVKTLIGFFNKLNDDIEISTNTIFNCQVQLSKPLIDIFTTRPYACEIEDCDTYPTFNLLNTKLSLNQIDGIENSIVDNLKTVILFDCERKKLMQYFSLQDIKDYDINLKNYLVLSFGNKNNSVHSLRDKLTLIQGRFKTPNNVSYSILQSEIDFVLKQKTKKHIPVIFYGIENSNFWDSFILETRIHDLYELRSVKMMNFYSLCFNEEIKNFILQDLFSNKGTSTIASDETKQRLIEFSDEDLLELKEALVNVLDLIIQSEIKLTLSKNIKNETVIVVDDCVLNSKELKGLFSSALLLSESNKLVSWSEFKNIGSGNILILSYQDQGKYPYSFYPNIIETTTSSKTLAIFHKFFFSNRYNWAKYNVAKDLYKLADHPIRQKHFNWGRLNNSIKSIKPQKSDEINWDLEHQYSGNANRETIKLKLNNERERTFDSSELFIYSTDKLSYRVDKIGDIIDSIDEDSKYFVHHLDKIQEDINLYEKMVDTSQQEKELNIIRQQFELDETETGRLWKVLLKQKASKTNVDDLYDELKNHLEIKGLKIVSLNHFKNNWTNPESDSTAPLNKRVFKELCSFLNLPKIYFILIQRLRNASKQSSRQSTRQMNRLLHDLFNDGCFDNGVDVNRNITSKLDNYKRKHPLDELGIHENYLGDNLIALVDLIKTEVALKEIERYKKVD